MLMGSFKTSGFSLSVALVTCNSMLLLGNLSRFMVFLCVFIIVLRVVLAIILVIGGGRSFLVVVFRVFLRGWWFVYIL